MTTAFIIQIQQAQNNQFNMHVHVEYEWRLRQDDWYESDDDLEDKVRLSKKACYLKISLES